MNNQYKRALEILNLTNKESIGGLYQCDKITLAQINKLIEECPKYIILNRSFNEAPTGEEFVNFMQNHSSFVAEGYFYDNTREIEGLIIVGIKAKNTKQNTSDLFQFVNNDDAYYNEPDEYGEYNGYIRAWWD